VLRQRNRSSAEGCEEGFVRRSFVDHAFEVVGSLDADFCIFKIGDWSSTIVTA
jgi:hypothetical protein